MQREVLGITLYNHADLEIVLRDFNAAYNGRRQRLLNGLSPEMVLRQRLEADPSLANPTYRPPSPSLIKRALHIVADAKEVSHPDNKVDFDAALKRIAKAKPPTTRSQSFAAATGVAAADA